MNFTLPIDSSFNSSLEDDKSLQYNETKMAVETEVCVYLLDVELQKNALKNFDTSSKKIFFFVLLVHFQSQVASAFNGCPGFTNKVHVKGFRWEINRFLIHVIILKNNIVEIVIT